MGTSSSSKGPRAKVPYFHQVPHESDDPVETLLPLAPLGRFRSTRNHLANFAKTGSEDELRKAIGNYVRKGYAGRQNLSSRLAGISQSAGNLWNVLTDLSEGQLQNLLAKQTADEIIRSIVNIVQKNFETLDNEVIRKSGYKALEHTLGVFPNADLKNLSVDERLYTIEVFVGTGIFHSIVLDVGMSIQKNAPSYKIALDRMEELYDFILSSVSSEFRAIVNRFNSVNSSQINKITEDAIENCLFVFESYIQ